MASSARLLKRATNLLILGISVTVPTYHEKKSACAYTPSLDDLFLKQKKLVGEEAVDNFVTDNSTIGIGSGSTVWFSIERLGKLLRDGHVKNVQVIPASQATARHCLNLGIPITSLSRYITAHSSSDSDEYISEDPLNLSDVPLLDLIIDGADEVDLSMAQIKGASGSIFGEKMLQTFASKVVIVVDERKLTRSIGSHSPIPIEVVQKDYEVTMKSIINLPSLPKSHVVLRRGSITNSVSDGSIPAVSDNGNFIVDLYCSNPIPDLALVSSDLDELPGIVCHGLFVGHATTIMVATKDTKRPIRMIGDHPHAEQPYWDDQPPDRALGWESTTGRKNY